MEGLGIGKPPRLEAEYTRKGVEGSTPSPSAWRVWACGRPTRFENGQALKGAWRVRLPHSPLWKGWANGKPRHPKMVLKRLWVRFPFFPL